MPHLARKLPKPPPWPPPPRADAHSGLNYTKPRLVALNRNSPHEPRDISIIPPRRGWGPLREGKKWGDRATAPFEDISIFGFQGCVAVYLSGASRADLMRSATSAFEMAKRATGAASGGSPIRRRSQARNSCRSRRSAAFRPDWKNRSALRWVEPRPALHRGLEQISAPHLATFQQRGGSNGADVRANKSDRSRR